VRKLKYILSVGAVILFAGIVFAQAVGTKSLGFIAPRINGVANIFSPMIGEIVYDSAEGGFYGYDQTAAWQKLGASSDDMGLPAGMIIPFAGSTLPDGYLVADGRSLDRATNSRLFTAIGTMYGSVDGDHFNIPDMRGLFIRGAGAQIVGGITYTGVLANKQNDATKKNGLSLSDPGHSHQAYYGMTGGVGKINGGGTGVDAVLYGNTIGHSYTGVTLSSGDVETRPANISLTYLIKL
jgi:hypothetical protein